MATFNTSIYNEQKDSRANPARLGATNVASGDVEFAVIPYTLATSEATSDVINLCALPAGAVPLPQLSTVTAGGDPSSGNFRLHIGTAADVDGWANTINLDAGGHVACMSGTLPAWIAPTPLAADAGSGNAVVFATVQSASGTLAGVPLYFTLAYKRSK